MSHIVTVYCDESGNDGPNYLNPQQPFYVLAGWAVPDNRIVDAAVAVERTRAAIVPDAEELKFKMFKKSEGRREAVITLMCELGHIGLVPIFVFAEKRYCVGAKIVETFLDPYYNPLVRNGLSWDAETKQELANTFYDFLSDATLQKFAAAYQRPAEPTLTAALSEVIDQSRGHVNPEIAQLLEGSRAEMPAIVAAELSAAESYEKAAGTLNFPCLVSYLMLLEHLARQGVLTPHRLVHDEQGPYQAGFEQVFLDHRHAADHWSAMIGQEIPHGPIRAIKTFETQRSVKQPLLQAADFLAGSINHVCSKLQTQATLTPTERQLAELILPLMRTKVQLAWPVCSDRMLRHMAAFIGESFGDTSSPPQTQPTAPVTFPVLPSLKTEPSPPSERPLSLPLFGIARVSDGALLFVPGCNAADEGTPQEYSFVPLFTDKAAAQHFYDEHHSMWDQPQAIRAYDAPELLELVTQLEDVSPHADVVIVNPLSDASGHLTTPQFAKFLRSIIERGVRAVRSGVIDVLLQSHQVDGRDAYTLLLSTGMYAAAWKDDDQRVHTGITREGALEALRTFDEPSAL